MDQWSERKVFVIIKKMVCLLQTRVYFGVYVNCYSVLSYIGIQVKLKLPARRLKLFYQNKQTARGIEIILPILKRSACIHVRA